MARMAFIRRMSMTKMKDKKTTLTSLKGVKVVMKTETDLSGNLLTL